MTSAPDVCALISIAGLRFWVGRARLDAELVAEKFVRIRPMDFPNRPLEFFLRLILSTWKEH